ncbi:MAG: hypothetical protein EXR75_12755 [Myxococcales bacterium]|nr:hypothetical protein [Myxococcales bacterium]
MTAADALARLRELVVEERDAIRAVDSERVVGLADEKERLICALRDGMASAGQAERDLFPKVVASLRENGVLLAHARNCLRDVLQLVSASSATYGAAGTIAGDMRGRRVSVNL